MSLPSILYALVTSTEKRQAKNSSLFWQATLKTPFGSIKGFMWNASTDAETSLRYPHTGDILQISDFVDQMADRGSIVINKFTRIPKDAIPEEAKSITEFEKASAEEMEWAWNVILDKELWEDKNHFKFVMECLKDLDKSKLNECPAATHVHHQHSGGLIVHTAEVLEMCRAIANCCTRKYSFINKDVLFASAILHDIGKLETYFINDIGVAQQLPTEKTIGHLFLGMHLVQSIAKKMKFDTTFVSEVLHCIASHHGDPQYGSIKNVQSVEAGILSKADYISSRNGSIFQVLNDAFKSSQVIQQTFTIYGDPYFYSSGMAKYMAELEEK